jgi:surface antigen
MISKLLLITALIFNILNVQAMSGLGLEEIIPEELTKSDIIIMKDSARNKLDNQPVDTIISWVNPESQNEGKVKLLRIFKNKGSECRTVSHYVNLHNNSDEFQYTSTICKSINGNWINLP